MKLTTRWVRWFQWFMNAFQNNWNSIYLADGCLCLFSSNILFSWAYIIYFAFCSSEYVHTVIVFLNKLICGISNKKLIIFSVLSYVLSPTGPVNLIHDCRAKAGRLPRLTELFLFLNYSDTAYREIYWTSLPIYSYYTGLD